MAKLKAQDSLRKACRDNLVSYSALAALNDIGSVLFVDSVNGADANSGKSWSHAKKTIADAVSHASAHDAIMLHGTFNEAVTCALDDVKFIGVGPSPRSVSWTAPTVAASFCLSPTGDRILLHNIYFKPVIYTTSGVPSALRLSGSNYLMVKECKFQGQTGSYTAIYSPVCDSDNVTIEDCEFNYMNTATNGCAILGVEAGGLSYSGWKILNTKFGSNLKHIDVNMRNSLIKGCVFPVGGIGTDGAATAALTTMCIDLSGTSSGGNVVTQNALGGEYDTDLYVAGTGDMWVGNYTLIEATEAPYGLTVADPAAED